MSDDKPKRIGSSEFQIEGQDVDVEFYQNEDVTHVIFDIGSPLRLRSRTLTHVMGVLFVQSCTTLKIDPIVLVSKLVANKKRKGMN